MSKELIVTTESDVLKAVEDNHIWINAFAIINPTDETLVGIGRSVVNMLRSNAIPSLMTIEPESENYEAFLKLSNLTKTLYLRVNAS